MEETKNVNVEQTSSTPQSSKSSFDFGTIWRVFILHWQWYVLSLIIFLGMAAIYLRYATPIYETSAKLLIKDNDRRSYRSSALNTSTLGMISNSNGIENEMEILKSHALAEQTVKDLKLYTTYYSVGKLKERLIYQNQPVNVDINAEGLNNIAAPINIMIKRANGQYEIEATYYARNANMQVTGPYEIKKAYKNLPATIYTKAGVLTFTQNVAAPMASGSELHVVINSPKLIANKYVGELKVMPFGSETTIARLILDDENPQRATDYLKGLAISYNKQANEDKNEVAMRTEAFINGRLEKINAELGNTEGQLESYKRNNQMVELKMNATQAIGNADSYSQKLAEANTQLTLLMEMKKYVDNPANRFQIMPSNVGLSDKTTEALIDNYNSLVQKRNILLQSASESSPSVTPITSQLESMLGSIRSALNQSVNNMRIQLNALSAQLNKYQGQVGQTPEQERMLTQIGRQQEVKSGLYLMLLQKREENSISLAATADKGRLIDRPSIDGQISPKPMNIYLIALILALVLPSMILFLIEFLRYKIEGHDDVARLTALPIIADVAIASDTAKTKADIVVHENKNNMMEEIFRSMRTNIQFMLKENQKTIMFTSSNSGEGKTFIAANLSVSFALLGKKVILVGLDIRKPRLAELLEIDDHYHGITNLLTKDNPTWSEIQTQILPSGVNNNLDILLSGPIPPNPAELVSRPSLNEIMDVLKENYDYIIIDTAPVGLVTDTLQIGKVADATIYVCRADYTPRQDFNLINGLAEGHKLPNMCIVINGIDMAKKKYGYYYGYGKYGKYGRYGRYGRYGHASYRTASYGHYGTYGKYGNSHYGDPNDDSIKK